MKKLALVAIVTAVAVSVVGCSSTEPGIPVPTSTTTEAAPTPAPEPADVPDVDPVELAEATYVETLDAEGIYYSSEQAAIDAGYAVCEFLATGGTELEAADAAMEVGYSAYESGYIVGAAANSLCLV